MSAYDPRVEVRFAAPPHAGPLPPGEGTLLRGEAGTLEAGTLVAFEARLAGGRITAMAFRAFGCPDTIAACSLAAEQLTGATPAEARALDPLGLRDSLGIPAGKTGRLLVIQDALRNCFAAWDNG